MYGVAMAERSQRSSEPSTSSVPLTVKGALASSSSMNTGSSRAKAQVALPSTSTQPCIRNDSPVPKYGFSGYSNLNRNLFDTSRNKRPRLPSASISDSSNDNFMQAQPAAEGIMSVKAEIGENSRHAVDEEDDGVLSTFESSLQAKIKALEEANAQLRKDNVAAHKLVEEIADIVTGCQYTLVKLACKINLFALFAYGHIYDDRRHQTVYAGTRAFSLQDVNMNYLFTQHLPREQHDRFRKLSEKRVLNLLHHWYEKNDRRLYHYLCARQTSILNVFAVSNGKTTRLPWFPGDEVNDEVVKVFRTKVLERYPMLRIFDENDQACWTDSKVVQPVGSAKAPSSSRTIVEDVAMVAQEASDTLCMTIDESRKAALLSNNLDESLLDGVREALTSPVEQVDLKSSKTVSAAVVRRTIEVSLRRKHDVQFWTTIKANFSDFFAGGLTSYDAGEELDLFSLLCPPMNDN